VATPSENGSVYECRVGEVWWCRWKIVVRGEVGEGGKSIGKSKFVTDFRVPKKRGCNGGYIKA
tara:strand:+ start:179 stop:367 length:189 start_codon:yes stop_codon:yes gene_type:complete